MPPNGQPSAVGAAGQRVQPGGERGGHRVAHQAEVVVGGHDDVRVDRDLPVDRNGREHLGGDQPVLVELGAHRGERGLRRRWRVTRRIGHDQHGYRARNLDIRVSRVHQRQGVGPRDVGGASCAINSKSSAVTARPLALSSSGARTFAESTVSSSAPPLAGSEFGTDAMPATALCNAVIVPAPTLPADPPPANQLRATMLEAGQRRVGHGDRAVAAVTEGDGAHRTVKDVVRVIWPRRPEVVDLLPDLKSAALVDLQPQAGDGDQEPVAALHHLRLVEQQHRHGRQREGLVRACRRCHRAPRC